MGKLGMERRAENRLISALKAEGFYAEHMDTGIEGFPDILVAKNSVVIPIEAKDGRRGKRLFDLVEPTQPVWHYQWALAKNKALLVTEDDGIYYAYPTNEFLRLVLTAENPSLSDVDLWFKGSAEDLAIFLDGAIAGVLK